MANYVIYGIEGYEELVERRDGINLDISMHPNMNSEHLEVMVEEINEALTDFRTKNPELFKEV